MSLFIYFILCSMMFLSSFFPVIARDEAQMEMQQIAAESDYFNIFAYANYVRDVFSEKQKNGTFASGTSPQYVRVHNVSISGAGSPVSGSAMPYLNADAISQYGLRNALVKAPDGRWWLYIWTTMSDLSKDAAVKRAFTRDSAAYYIKKGNKLISGRDTGKTIDLYSVSSLIPEGAMVLTRNPIQSMP